MILMLNKRKLCNKNIGFPNTKTNISLLLNAIILINRFALYCGRRVALDPC